jgi:hypothetical protein
MKVVASRKGSTKQTARQDETSAPSERSSDIPSESEEIVSTKDINGLGKNQLKMKIEQIKREISAYQTSHPLQTSSSSTLNPTKSPERIPHLHKPPSTNQDIGSR